MPRGVDDELRPIRIETVDHLYWPLNELALSFCNDLEAQESPKRRFLLLWSHYKKTELSFRVLRFDGKDQKRQVYRMNEIGLPSFQWKRDWTLRDARGIDRLLSAWSNSQCQFQELRVAMASTASHLQVTDSMSRKILAPTCGLEPLLSHRGGTECRQDLNDSPIKETFRKKENKIFQNSRSNMSEISKKREETFTMFLRWLRMAR